MRHIAVTNQKGGVGKTTTTVNLGAALAREGQRVLICDLDPQCNLTVHVDVDPSDEAPCLYDLLMGKATLAEIARPTADERLDVAPAGIDLAGVELELANEVGRELILREAFRADEEAQGSKWDFVLVDCPPSLGLLSLNAMVACNEVFVPIQAEFFALQGLGKLMEVVQLVQQRLNPRLAITGLVSCRYDPSTNLSKAVIADVKKHFGDVFMQTYIRRNVKLTEAPSHGKTIFAYDPESRGALDYLQLAREVLGLDEASTVSKNGAPAAVGVQSATDEAKSKSKPKPKPKPRTKARQEDDKGPASVAPPESEAATTEIAEESS